MSGVVISDWLEHLYMSPGCNILSLSKDIKLSFNHSINTIYNDNFSIMLLLRIVHEAISKFKGPQRFSISKRLFDSRLLCFTRLKLENWKKIYSLIKKARFLPPLKYLPLVNILVSKQENIPVYQYNIQVEKPNMPPRKEEIV